MRHFLFAAGALVSAALLLSGCEGDDFTIEPALVSDTVDLATPRPGNAGLPSGLDITGSGVGVLNGPRFPERAQDAGQWDFVVRDAGGQIVLVPASVVGIASRAALTPPIVGETYQSLREAPAVSEFRTDTTFVLEQGRVYSARSRSVNCGFGMDEQFAKLTPVSVDPATGRVRIAVTTNERCGDPRLAEDEE